MGRWFLVVALVNACDPHDGFQVEDTSGARFFWRWDGVPEPLGDTPPPSMAVCAPDQHAIYAWGFWRFIDIASACADEGGGWTTSGPFQRPLACETSHDCPQFANASFECRNGICQNADVNTHPPAFVEWKEAYELCYAALPREQVLEPLGETALRIEAVLDAACPGMYGACTLPLPEPCLQP